MPLGLAPDDWTIQEGLQQLAIGDDRCGEIDLAYAAERNGFVVADEAGLVAQLRQTLGLGPMDGGTTIEQENQGAQNLATLLDCDVDVAAILPQPNADFKMSDYPDFSLIIATKLGYIVNPSDPDNANVQGDHFLLFDDSNGRQFHCLDSCHDVDGALGHPDGWLNMDDVLAGSRALLGDNSVCGFLVRYRAKGDSTVTPTDQPTSQPFDQQSETPPAPMSPEDERNQEEAQINHLTQFAVNILRFCEFLPQNAESAGFLDAAKAHAAAMSPNAAQALVDGGVSDVPLDPTSEAGIQQAMQQACSESGVPIEALRFVRQNESGNATGEEQRTVTNPQGYGGFFGLPQRMLGSTLEQCRAACEILSNQHATFGNWKEAICAYNVGPRGDFSQSYCGGYTGPE